MTLAAIAAAGCYSPELRDCIVACTATDECAPDQVCGSDGRCAAPELAGRCASMTDGPNLGSPDAAVDGRAPADAAIAIDAAPVDAAPSLATLRVSISGRGHVVVNNVLSLVCSHTSSNADCTFTLAPGPVSLRAYAGLGFHFERWMGACTSTNDTCATTLQVAAPTVVEAKFRNDNSGNNDDDE